MKIEIEYNNENDFEINLQIKIRDKKTERTKKAFEMLKKITDLLSESKVRWKIMTEIIKLENTQIEWQNQEVLNEVQKLICKNWFIAQRVA